MADVGHCQTGVPDHSVLGITQQITRCQAKFGRDSESRFSPVVFLKNLTTLSSFQTLLFTFQCWLRWYTMFLGYSGVL